MMPEPQTPEIPVSANASAKPGSSDQPSNPITLIRGSSVVRSIRTRSIAPTVARWPQRDLGPFERRAGRAGSGEQPLVVAEHDLGVGPDVDQQLDRRRPVRAFARIAAAVSAPTWPAMHGARYSWAFGYGSSRSVASRVHRFAGRQFERRTAERRRVDPEHDVMHDRVADEHDVEQRARRRARPSPAGQRSARQSAPRIAAVSRVAARVHHHVRDPAHQVLAEADLGVHRPRRSEHLAGAQVAEMPGDGGRPDVDGDADRPCRRSRARRRRSAAPSATATVVAVRRADRPVKVAAAPGARTRADRVRWSLCQRVEQPANRAAVVTEVCRFDDDVAQMDPRVDAQIAEVDALADHRTVDLARRRNVDHGVGGDPQLAPEPGARRRRRGGRGTRPPTRSADRTRRVGFDRPLGERARAGDDCAPAADPRPPQTESRSTPSRRATSSTVGALQDVAVRLDGVNTTRGRV